MIRDKFKVKCIELLKIMPHFLTIDKEYEVSFHPERTDFYLTKNDTGASSYQPSYLFEPIDILEFERVKELHQKDLEHWRSIKKVVCVTKELNGSVYKGGVIVGEIYDVIEYNPNYFRTMLKIKGKLEEQRIISDLYPKELFITLEEHRQNQLEKIL